MGPAGVRMCMRRLFTWRLLMLAYLISFDPYYLINACIPPYTQAFPSDLHGPPSNPQEEKTFVLQSWNRHLPHFVIRHGAIGELQSIE
jgi:hypothetical protein